MIPNSGKQRIENLEQLAAWIKATRNRETTPELNDGVIELRLARTCDDGDYPEGNSRTYPLMFLDGPGGNFKDHAKSCQVPVAYSLIADCHVEKNTHVLAWRQNNEWWFLPGLCNQGDKVEHILICKVDAALEDCCLYDARMIEHGASNGEYCQETTKVTPVWARCANGYVDSLADGFCVLGKKLDDRAVCTLDDIAEERDVYLIDCGNCPSCLCPDPCDTLTARVKVLPEGICDVGEIVVELHCSDGNPLQVDDGEGKTWYYGAFTVTGKEQRMLWGANGKVLREVEPDVFQWVDENFWLEIVCQGETGEIIGVYYQDGEPGSSPVTEEYELLTGIAGCCPFLDSGGNPQYIERDYNYALTISCDIPTQIFDGLRIWWIKDGWGVQAGDTTTLSSTICRDECGSSLPALEGVPSTTGFWAARSFESWGECCANSKRFRAPIILGDCNQNFATDPEIRIAGIPDIIPGSDPPEENENICPGCIMGGQALFAGCDCGVLYCDGVLGDGIPKTCDFDPDPIPGDGDDCNEVYIVVDISWPLSWGAA